MVPFAIFVSNGSAFKNGLFDSPGAFPPKRFLSFDTRFSPCAWSGFLLMDFFVILS